MVNFLFLNNVRSVTSSPEVERKRVVPVNIIVTSCVSVCRQWSHYQSDYSSLARSRIRISNDTRNKKGNIIQNRDKHSKILCGFCLCFDMEIIF